MFVPSAVITAATVVLSGALALYLIKKSAEEELQAKFQSIVNIFTEDISHSLLIGAHAEVYRKCKILLRDRSILGISVVDSQNFSICSTTKREGISSTEVITSHVYFDQTSKEMAATIQIVFSQQLLSRSVYRALVVLVIALVSLFIIFVWIGGVIGKKITWPIVHLSRRLSQHGLRSLFENSQEVRFSNIKEINELYKNTRKLVKELETAQAVLVRATKKAAMGEIASRVAHDIRSPLTALQMLGKSSSDIPEEQRVLLRQAATRIQDIANSLVEKHRQLLWNDNTYYSDQDARHLDNTHFERVSTQQIAVLIETLVSEKRIQFSGRKDIKINTVFTEEAYSIFAKVEIVEFKRILSNLINNAVEAIPNNGEVSIRLCNCSGDNFCIEVSDNGCGMSEELLKKATERGVTANKKHGLGLGLYYAKSSLGRWHGELTIDSRQNMGTNVKMIVPKAPPPNWYVPKIHIKPNSDFVVLDDDIFIHHVWTNRLGPLKYLHSINQVDLSNYTDASSYLAQHKEQGPSIYLFDYELLGSKKTGLDLIKEYRLEQQSILVTSRFEEMEIQELCTKWKVKLLPKMLANTVPLLVMPELNNQSSLARYSA